MKIMRFVSAALIMPMTFVLVATAQEKSQKIRASERHEDRDRLLAER
jgi:hypothetical protein